MSEPAGKQPTAQPRTIATTIASVLATALTIGAGAWALQIQQYMAWSLYSQQFFAAALGLALALSFLILPAKRASPRTHVPWYDFIASLLAIAACGWIAVRYPVLVNMIFAHPTGAYVPGAIVLLLLLEALRRAVGWSLVIIIAVFVLYALFGNHLPGRLTGRAQDWRILSAYLAFDINGILGLPMAVVSTIVIAFVFFGSVLEVTGGGRFFTDSALIAMGRLRGGPMKICVVASCLFGMISGSAVADVVAIGIVSIPLMKGAGYPAYKAAGVQSVASTGAQMMPPVMGAAAFVMAEFLQTSYANVALAALVPGLLYYAALFIQADLESARLGMRGLPASEIPSARRLITGWPFIVAFAVLIVTLFRYNWQPGRSALAAAGVAVVLSCITGYQGQRPKPAELARTIEKTGRGVIDIVLIGAGAGIVIGILNITGLSFNLTYLLVQVGSSSAALLLVLAAIVCIILGMGMPTLGVYVLLAALVAPSLIQLGITPMAAHLYILYFGMMSMITPPVAVAAFAGAAIARADPMRTGFAAMRFGWTAFIVPFLFVASPSLILIGSPWVVALAVVTAFFGVWLVSIAMVGYFVRPLGWPLRILFGACGLLALIPATAFAGAYWTDVVGIGLGVVLIGYEITRQRTGAAILRDAETRT